MLAHRYTLLRNIMQLLMYGGIWGGQHDRYGVHTSWEDVALFTYINKIGLGRQTTEAHFVGNAPEVKRMDKHFAKPFA